MRIALFQGLIGAITGVALATASATAAAAQPDAAQQAAPPTTAADRWKQCEVPAEFDGDAERLPGFSKALKSAGTPLSIVVLSAQAAGGARDPLTGSIAYPPRLQAMLSSALSPELANRPLVVEAVTKSRATVHELAALIPTRVLPLKPTLVIWQIGRGDARRGNSPQRYSSTISSGVDQLYKQGIDVILMDNQYHPQFEALYRTDDYRQYLRWLAGKRNLPLLRRYQMIEFWDTEDRIDLDSGLQSVQRQSADFIQDCIAWQASRMIVEGIALARRP